MKINEPARPAAVTRRSPELRRANGFAASVGQAEGGGRPSPAAPLTAPLAILALQEVGEDGGGRRRAVARAHDMLDELEKLRLATVEGMVPESALRRLAAFAADHAGARSVDPRLDAILQDVEVRAAVEVAKRRPAGRPDEEGP